MANSLKLNDPLVQEFISTNAGKEAFKVIKYLDKGRTDEQISKRVKMNVNDVRALLNRLHYMGVIVYSKEKAKDSNWYTYTWFIKKERIAELLKDRYLEELEKLKEKLCFEQNYTFFKCSNGCNKLPFELAFEYDFKCPECGNMMESVDNDKERKKVENKIKLLSKSLEFK
jgi:transcription initiation factor TFIIE subunit alpha